MVRNHLPANSTSKLPPLEVFYLTDTRQVDDSKSEESKTQVVRAVLMNLNNTSFESATFVLPSALPEERLSTYHIAYDANDQSYRVWKIRRFPSTWTIAAMLNDNYHNSCPVSATTTTSKASPCPSGLAGPATNGQPLNTQPTNTLPILTQSPRVEVSHPESVPSAPTTPTTDLGNGYYRSPSGDDGADPAEEERKINTSYYVSSSGVDWAEIMEEEESVIAPDATSYYISASGVDWAEIMEEDDNLDSSIDEAVSTHTSQKTQVVLNKQDAQGEFNDVVRPQYNTKFVNSPSLANEFPSPMLRNYIPAEAEAEIQAEFGKITEPQEDDLLFQYARGIIEWRHMCKASQQLLAAGESKRRPQLKEADRSVAWFWKLDVNGNATGAKSDHDEEDGPSRSRDAPCEPDEATWKPWERPEEGPMHHFNFAGRPVLYKSATPPAVSLWAAFSSNLFSYPRYVENGFPLRTHILSSQAGIYLDPFTVTDLQQIPGLEGTKLQESVTGHVEKAYPPCGAWQWDDLEPDEDRPRSYDETDLVFSAGLERFSSPTNPYIIYRERDGDVVINAEGHVHSPGKTKRKSTSVGKPSKLNYMEVCEYLQDEAMDQLPSNDFHKQRAEVAPGADLATKLCSQEERDASPQDILYLSDAETDSETRVGGSSLMAPSLWVEGIYKGLAQVPVPIVQTPRPRIRFGNFAISSEDDDGASEYTDQSSSSSPKAVEETSSPSSAEEDLSYENFCVQLKDISELMEGLESDDEELSVCGSSHQGSDDREPETQDEGTLAKEKDLQPTPIQPVEEETAPQLDEDSVEHGTVDALAGEVVEESLLEFVDEGLKDHHPALLHPIEEESASKLVKESVEVGTADGPADEAAGDFVDEASEEDLEEVVEEAAEEEVGEGLEVEVREEFLRVVEEKDTALVGAPKEDFDGALPKEAGAISVAPETSAECRAQGKEYTKQAELEASAPDMERGSGAFFLPSFSDCLLYGSIAAYVGFRVYSALKR